jgi:hypothetical protein
MADEAETEAEPTDEELKEVAADLLCLGAIECPEVDVTRPGYTEEAYPIWDESNSRVISGPLWLSKFRGTRFGTWQEAKAYAEAKYQVVKFWVFGQRWHARIKR